MPAPSPDTRPQRWMLDTNMASHIIRGADAALIVTLRSVPLAQLCISAITQAELLHGLARRPDATRLTAIVRAFLERMDVLPWDAAAAERYGPLRASLESRGEPLGHFDTLIAAHALASGAVLVTRDKAFTRVDGLAVETWMAGAAG